CQPAARGVGRTHRLLRKHAGHAHHVPGRHHLSRAAAPREGNRRGGVCEPRHAVRATRGTFAGATRREPHAVVSGELRNARFSAGGVELPGIQTAPWFVTTHTSKFDFSLTVERSAEGCTAGVEYSTDLFE